MNKEIILLIRICKTNKLEFQAEELAALLSLKFTEGVYPYVRKLINEQLLVKKEKGTYSINPQASKIQTIRILKKLFPKELELLLSVHTKNMLQRFSIKPILKASDLPAHTLRNIKDIAKKTRLIHLVQPGKSGGNSDGKSDVYLLRSWEEPVKKILEFFAIHLQFDEEEYKHNIIKTYSAFTGKQTHLLGEHQQELAKLNMQYYLEGQDYILNKLKNIKSTETTVLDVLTKEKIKRLTNPFELTRKINEWKIRYVYHTDKIEGNELTYDEVKTGLTKGWEGIKKEKKDILETENSKKAIENIFDTNNELNLDFIKHLHLITQQGIDQNAGSYKQEENCVIDSSGILIDQTTPVEFVDDRLRALLEWYSENEKELHPIVLASVFHNQFVYIHPFLDGNGRVSRLLLNFILIKHAFFPVIIHNDEKYKYYASLRQSKDGDLKPFIMYVSETYRVQLELF